MLKKLICFILVCSLSMSGISFSFADTESTTENNIDSISDDTIVCYYEGTPITKGEIDKHNIINQETIEKIDSNVSNPNVRMSYKSKAKVSYNTKVIPSRYNSAIVKVHLKAPRFNQTTIKYYYTRNRGAKFASGLDTGTWTTIAGTAAGFIPQIGPAITIVFGAVTLYKANIASKIRSYTDNGKKVKISEIKSSYGTFYAVSGWTGKKIQTNAIYTDGYSKETIKNLQYK